MRLPSRLSTFKVSGYRYLSCCNCLAVTDRKKLISLGFCVFCRSRHQLFCGATKQSASVCGMPRLSDLAFVVNPQEKVGDD